MGTEGSISQPKAGPRSQVKSGFGKVIICSYQFHLFWIDFVFVFYFPNCLSSPTLWVQIIFFAIHFPSGLRLILQAEAARAQQAAEGDRQRHLQERVEAESRAAVAEVWDCSRFHCDICFHLFNLPPHCVYFYLYVSQ